MVSGPSAGPAPQFISPHRRPTRFIYQDARNARWLLAVVDGDEADDFKFLLAGGRGNFDFVADLAVEEGLADGGGGGDETLLGVGFLAAHELVIDFDVALHVQNGELGTVAGAVFWDIAEVQHAEIAHALLEMADLEVDVALAFLGVLVFGVFGEVAVSAGDSDLLGKLDAELMGELVDFVLELFLNLGEWVGHGSGFQFAKKVGGVRNQRMVCRTPRKGTL